MEWETIHLLTLSLTACAVVYADHLGFAYMRGKVERLSAKLTHNLHRMVWTGLIGMMLSGFFLILPEWEYLRGEGVFYVKMGFVLVLIMNAYAIGKLSHVASLTPYRELDIETKKTLLVSGALSFLGWTGAAVIGFFFL